MLRELTKDNSAEFDSVLNALKKMLPELTNKSSQDTSEHQTASALRLAWNTFQEQQQAFAAFAQDVLNETSGCSHP